MATLADVFVRLRLDPKGFSGELKSKTEAAAGSAGKQVGSTFGKGMLAGVGAVFAAGAVVSFFKGAIAEATEAAKVGRLTEAVIKSTGGAAKVTAAQVGDLAEQLSELSGVDDEVIQSGANLLLTFTKVRNEVGKGNQIFDQATATALDMSAALGQDLQSSVTQLGKALNDPIKGVTALQRVGVSFTESQREQIRVMVEAGDVMGAQKLILAELTTEFGGAAEAARTPAEQATVAWGNFQEMVGGKVLPVLNDILQFGLRNQEWLVPLATSIGSLALVIGTVVVATKAWGIATDVLGIGLDGTAVKAKRWALGIGAALVAAQALGGMLRTDLNPQIEALANDLARFGREGRLHGEALRIFGANAEDLTRALSVLSSDNLLGSVGTGFADVASSLVGLQGPSAEARERLAALDTALATMASSGHSVDAAAAFKLVFDEAQRLGIPLETLQGAFPEYVNAAAKAASATSQLGGAAQEAARAGESLLDVWKDLHGTMLSADEAMLDAQQAIDDVADAFKEGGKSIAGNSVAALENRIALERAAHAAAESAQRFMENGGSAADAAKMMADFRVSAEKATGATGNNAKAVHDLAAKLFALPETKQVTVEVKLHGFAGVYSALQSLARNVFANVSFRPQADGGVLGFAAGGLAENHVAQIVRAGMVRVWGEPETGGEAYIPLSPAKRGRSTAILADVARRFGFGLVAGAGGAATLVGTTQPSGLDTERILERLDMLVDAVGRIPYGVGREINGAADVMHQMARAR